MNRRKALKLLAALPFAALLKAQTRSTAQHRVFTSGGHLHGLLLEPDGKLQSWFSNEGAGQELSAPDVLGLGDTRRIEYHTLYPVADLESVATAAAGAGVSFAVRKDGRIFAWGSSGSGQLGITPREEFEAKAQPRMRTNKPTPLSVSFNAIDISCKGDHVVALARDGSVYTWGRGDSGQLGIGPLPVVNFKTTAARVERYVPYPVRVPDLEGVIAISAGNDHSLALLKDGTVRAWGLNRYGQIGDGTRTNRDRPVAVPGVRNAIAIAAGAYRSAAVLDDGTVMDWGASHVNLTPRPVPALIANARGIRSVVAGSEHVAAITRTGEVMTWGLNSHYNIGRSGDPHTAGFVKSLTGVKWLAAGAGTTIAVLESGRMMTWGEVRPWTRPDPGQKDLSPSPILLWLDGLEQS